MLRFVKNEVNRKQNEAHGGKVIPTQCFVSEENDRKNREDNQRNCLLNNLKLNEAEWTAEFFRTDTVGGNLKDVFEKRKPPADKNNGEQP